MDMACLYAWDDSLKGFRKLVCNSEGKLIIDPSEIFENVPTDNEHGKAPDSDWAYEHENNASAHHTRYTDEEATDSFGNRTTIFTAGTYYSNDMTDINLVYLDSSGGQITLAGLGGGYDGKMIIFIKYKLGNSVTIYHDSIFPPVGNRIYTANTAHVPMSGARYGGFILVYKGDHWYMHNLAINNTSLWIDNIPVDGQLNNSISSNWAYDHSIGSSRIRVKRNTAQAIASATYVKVQYDSEDYDNLSEYDNATDYCFTANVAGYYFVRASLRLDSTAWLAGEYYYLMIYKNGAIFSYLFLNTVEANTTMAVTMAGSDLVQLAANDDIEIYVRHSHGASINVFADDKWNYLSIHKVN